MVKLVAENLVPVTLNTDRLPDTADGKFFRALMKQWPQGLWVVTPEGKVLGFHYHRPKSGESYAAGQQRWRDETAQMLRDAVKEAGTLTARDVKERPDPLAGRGIGLSDEGEARLAVSVVGLVNGRRDGPPVMDSIHLPADEWTAFAPPAKKATAGAEWAIPEAATRPFAPALCPMTDSIFSPRPRDVTVGMITAKVERVEGGIAVIRYAGKWDSAHNRDGDPKYPIRAAAVGEGVAVFDTKTGKVTAMVWLLNGSYRYLPPPDKPRGTVAVIEWSAKP